MKNTQQLFIALAFAGAAVFLNFIWVQQYLPSYGEYTIYSQELSQGEMLEPQHLDVLRLPERSDLQLSEVFVPWEERGTLLGLQTSRPIRAKELALKTDISVHAIPPEVSMLGPFQLLVDNEGEIVRGQNATLTLVVATRTDSNTGLIVYEPKVKQLLSILERDQNNRISSIRAVVAMPENSIPRSGPPNNNSARLTINLPNVPALSSFWENPSSSIGFIVPVSLIPNSKE